MVKCGSLELTKQVVDMAFTNGKEAQLKIITKEEHVEPGNECQEQPQELLWDQEDQMLGLLTVKETYTTSKTTDGTANLAVLKILVSEVKVLCGSLDAIKKMAAMVSTDSVNRPISTPRFQEVLLELMLTKTV